MNDAHRVDNTRFMPEQADLILKIKIPWCQRRNGDYDEKLQILVLYRITGPVRR